MELRLIICLIRECLLQHHILSVLCHHGLVVVGVGSDWGLVESADRIGLLDDVLLAYIADFHYLSDVKARLAWVLVDQRL